MSSNDIENTIITIDGTVDKITYKNDTNGYTVALVRVGREKITVVGIMPFLAEGEDAKFTGKYTIHPSYGKQFSVETFERCPPATAAAILRYLSSGIIKGVGPGTATKIVEKFGADSLDIIENHPIELSVIRGISESKALAISEEYKKQYGIRDIMLLLSPYEVTPDRCVEIYKKFGKNSAQVIRDNPYLLCNTEIDFPFESVEKIAFDLGIGNNDEMRLSAGIQYVLRKNLMNGHTCLPRHKLLNVSSALLSVDEISLETVCDRMIESFIVRSKTINNEDFIALPDLYTAEEYISARLASICRYNAVHSDINDLEIDYVENKLGIKFEEFQRTAIKNAFSNGIFILTGGPGTGKTTTLNAIIELFERRDANIMLAAPTGRAAKRMTELTGREAKTIHRMLEVEWTSDSKHNFMRNERNPLECDVLILDEASMVDSLLFESLLRALKMSCRIIVVGDTDQLPSVSAGNILNDMLSSEKFASTCLQKVFRQASQSAIVTNAHAIINETEIDFSNNGKDFFIMRRNNSFDACDTILELCSERLSKAYGFDCVKDIQVLCPSRKLNTGTYNLNNLLQSALNPHKTNTPQLSYKGVYFRIGDKVMQTKNNYDLTWQRDNGEMGCGVFNGDVGYITHIDIRGGILNVRYDDRIATYLIDSLSEIELAYAITVHKSQGSEFDCVVLPLLDIPSPLKYRNLLYTAVTRAKKMLVIVGNEQTFCEMAANNRKTLRYTLLKEFLKNAFS